MSPGKFRAVHYESCVTNSRRNESFIFVKWNRNGSSVGVVNYWIAPECYEHILCTMTANKCKRTWVLQIRKFFLFPKLLSCLLKNNIIFHHYINPLLESIRLRYLFTYQKHPALEKINIGLTVLSFLWSDLTFTSRSHLLIWGKIKLSLCLCSRPELLINNVPGSSLSLGIDSPGVSPENGQIASSDSQTTEVHWRSEDTKGG